MNGMPGTYFNGNAARKIQFERTEYDVYSENAVLYEKKRNRVRGKVAAKVVTVVFLVFLMGFTVMYRYALLTEMNYKIEQLNQEYKKLKDHNSMLKVEIGEKTVLEEIGEAAKTRLGMAPPVNSQIIHVRVPGEDCTILSEEYKNNEKPSSAGEGTFAVLVDRISRLAKLLY